MILCLILICALTALFICWMLLIWERVPGMIHIRAGVQQELDLNVPVSGELYRNDTEEEHAGKESQSGEDAVAAARMNAVNPLPQKSLSVNLSEPITLYAEALDSYCLRLKLFGLIPFKTVQVEVIDDKTLIPAGIPIGIYVKTEGVLVIATGEFEGPDGQTNAPAARLLKEGDYILKADGEAVTGKAEFMQRIADSGGEEMTLTILRDGQQFDVSLTPEQNQNGEYKLGIWIRDNAQGVGTLTWLDTDNSFGALGHGIHDTDTNVLMSISDGTVYRTSIQDVTKGSDGNPGSMEGIIIYNNFNVLGTIDKNTDAGIYGTIDRIGDLFEEQIPIETAKKEEIVKGDATIRCFVDNEIREYEIQVTDIDMSGSEINKGLVIKVTDEELEELYGLLADSSGVTSGGRNGR